MSTSAGPASALSSFASADLVSDKNAAVAYRGQDVAVRGQDIDWGLKIKQINQIPELQKAQFSHELQFQQRAETALNKAGLPSYLAYVNPTAEMTQTRHLRGANFQTVFRGSPTQPWTGLYINRRKGV